MFKGRTLGYWSEAVLSVEGSQFIFFFLFFFFFFFFFAGSIVLRQWTQKFCGIMVLGSAVIEEIAIKKKFQRPGGVPQW